MSGVEATLGQFVLRRPVDRHADQHQSHSRLEAEMNMGHGYVAPVNGDSFFTR
jgi:hypothetical protein